MIVSDSEARAGEWLEGGTNEGRTRLRDCVNQYIRHTYSGLLSLNEQRWSAVSVCPVFEILSANQATSLVSLGIFIAGDLL